MDFIDLFGASGATYRFRLWSEGGALLPVAGNFVVAVAGPASVEVLVVGLTNDLSRAEAAAGSEEGQIYRRLNVARAAREAEHDDLAAGYPQARVVGELR
ncbi:hypothetical protein M9M90_13640 [Phenylobacterium sp. LH3H17]|uniref:hypothetical protein n=1 Tax=Phenylobacterium sp. LH3H17 TaxID=2903901 RepID=UPI0020C9DCDD|nr:hypothetical protein [Phenylobacterium sp. LH3H17]UTP38256.1 hypothetical protein M9M90_13640 [Phenylobacterium sp. LH3H17]